MLLVPVEVAFTLAATLLELCHGGSLVGQLQEGHREKAQYALV